MSEAGWIAEIGKGKYRHRFGGTGWKATGPLDDSYGPPILILTLDLHDPRLVGLKAKGNDCRELPLFSYINGMFEDFQSYSLDHTNNTAIFDSASPLSGKIEPLEICPNPLPTRDLKLRPMKPTEFPKNEDAADTLLGEGWLRILGLPLWLYDEESHQSSRGGAMKYVASVGYDITDPSPFLDEPDILMFGEMALYFFVSDDLSEVVVSYQST